MTCEYMHDPGAPTMTDRTTRNSDKRVPAKRKPKALGDKPYFPANQTVGMMTGHELDGDSSAFMSLAESYRFHGEDKPAICAHNAEVSDGYSKMTCLSPPVGCSRSRQI